MDNIAQGASPTEEAAAIDYVPLNFVDTALAEEGMDADSATSPSHNSPSIPSALVNDIVEVQLQRKVDAQLQLPASGNAFCQPCLEYTILVLSAIGFG
jgi:hypothetical protein